VSLKSLLASKYFPGVIQWPTFILFVLVLYNLFLGTADPAHNFGSVMTWVLWWPALAVLFLLVGRLWCTACPFSLISDVVQVFVGNHRSVPRLLRDYAIWIMSGMILVLTWAEAVFGIADSPLATGILLLTIATGVLAAGAFFERRSWCRYLCPLGGMAGIYSRIGIIELRGSRETCSSCVDAVCHRGTRSTPGCPMFESPKVLKGNDTCNFCGSCVKNCPHDSIRISSRIPSSEIWSFQRPRLGEAFLAVSLAGVIVAMNLLEVSQDFFRGFMGLASFEAGFTAFYLLALLLPLALAVVGAGAASKANADSVRQNFARFGYAFIPIVLFSHIGHTQVDFLEKGRLIIVPVLSALGWAFAAGDAGLAGESVVKGLQITLLCAGLALSLYSAYRIAAAHYGKNRGFLSATPFALLLVGYAILNTLLILHD
jgi:ferredoxin